MWNFLKSIGQRIGAFLGYAQPVTVGAAIQNKQAEGEEALVSDLLSTQGESLLQEPSMATPEGYQYVPYSRSANDGEKSLGKTLFLSPHPSDVSADFFPLLIDKMKKLGGECRQVLLTRGEEGDSGGEYRKVLMERGKAAEPILSKDGIINLREAEEEGSSKIVGINRDYLATKDGAHTSSDDDFFFPDGQLMRHLPKLTERLMEYIERDKPDRLAIPGIYPDHPDHLATAIAAINAVIRLRDKGFFENTKMEIITSDPEFAVAIGQPWAVKQVPVEFGGSLGKGAPDYEALKLDPNIKYFKYRYVQDPKTGLVYPSPDITAQRENEVSFDKNQIAVAPFIVGASDEAEHKKTEAMKFHDSQFNHGKPYLRLIKELDQLRGLQLLSAETKNTPKYAFGLFPINIEGVTPNANALIDILPDVYQLKKVQPANVQQI